MRKFDLIPTGGLNRDVDVNSLPKGDYVDARNIIISSGKNGGGNSIKVLESIKDVGLDAVSGIEKAWFDNSDGVIYQLYRNGSANSSIYKVSADLSTRTLVLTYPHGVTVDFKPDLKVIGNTLVWNYHGVGTVLYWNLNRADGSTVAVTDLLLAKSPPVNVLSISKTVSEGSGIDFLEDYDLQFASRYKYDSSEYSVLGNFSNMYKGEEDTASYSISFSLSNKPTYATDLEVFVRVGKSGSWKRIKTIDISGGSASAITWKGDVYELLDTKASAMQFSAIPASARHIEIAVDRVWLSNFDDDYNDDSVGELVISSNTGYTLPSGGSLKNYFGADTTDAGIKSTENGTFYKPFANNSLYSVGIVLFDEAMKTKGVEFVSNFQTGSFDEPICPTFSINSSGYTKPSYAKYMQLCVSENLTKGYIYEGFANSLYFQLLVDEEIDYKLSIDSSDLSNLTYAVLDISGMFKSGLIYSFNEGDRITLNCPDGVENVVDADGSQTGSYRILDMQVVGSDGDKIYLEWNGGACLNDGVPDATSLYFEVYTPKQQSEDDNLLFYGVGDVIDISSSIPSTITDYTIGDMVFSKFSFKPYSDQFLYKGLQRSNPPEITTGAESVVRSTKTSGDVANIVSTSAALTANTRKNEVLIVFDSIGNNDDELSIVGGNAKIKGFYDSQCVITYNPSYTIQVVIQGNTDLASISCKAFARIERVPFNVETNAYDSPVAIGTKKLIYEQVFFNETLDNSAGTFKSSSFDFDITSNDSIIGSQDLIKVYLETQVTCSDRTVDSATLTIKEKSGETNSSTLTILGDRIAPVDKYSKRLSVNTEENAVQFVVRATSNNNNGGEWNFSGGKPYLQEPKKESVTRTNAIRHSGNLIYGTEQNNISQFFALDTVEVPKENGDIMSLQRATRLQGEGDMLLAVCRKEASYLLLGETRAIQSNNSSFSGLTSNIVGSIRNLGEQTGIQNKESIYNHNGDIYWWDNQRNIVIEFVKGRFEVISDKKMRSDFVSKSGVAKFAFDPFYNIMFVKIGSAVATGYNTIGGYWSSDFDLDFVGALHYGERCLFFSGGKVYRSLESESGNKVGEYIETTYDSYIDLTANTLLPIYPKFIRVNHSMDVIDYANSNKVKSSLMEFEVTNENGQETNVLENNFLLENNKLYAHVLRDENSVGGIINGTQMQGYNNNFKLKLKDKTQENRIFGIEVGFDAVTGH